MKREIKFKFIVDKIHITRPYTIEELLFLNEEDILEQMEVCICQFNESNNHCECEPEFCNSEITGKIQYIGKKDKNCKEIYEGDTVTANGYKIVKIKDNSELRLYVNSNIKDEFKTIEERSNFICYWNESFSSFSFKSETHSINMDVGKRDYKIIGNIHQNKDLIK